MAAAGAYADLDCCAVGNNARILRIQTANGARNIFEQRLVACGSAKRCVASRYGKGGARSILVKSLPVLEGY
jgi:hypothetical protein